MSSRPLLRCALAVAFVLMTAAGCGGQKKPAEVGEARPMLCAAIRGNGQLITAHFAALARIIEHYGLIDGASGGSSGSITLFFLESIQVNPQVTHCGASLCEPHESAARAALLLKSLQGYLKVLASTDEAVAVGSIERLSSLAQAVEAEGAQALRPGAENDVARAINGVVTLLSSQEVRDLVNPELPALLTSSPNPPFHLRDIVDGVKNTSGFGTQSSRILFRPGLLNFGHAQRAPLPAPDSPFGRESLPEKLGRVASFYAGYGPAPTARMEAFLSSCGEAGRGLNWRAVAALPVDVSALPENDVLREQAALTCGDIFGVMVKEYRTAFLAQRAHVRSRIDDQVGGTLHALISTSVLRDGTAAEWRRARGEYLAGRETSFAPDFAGVSFGYWGRQADLLKVAANEKGYSDEKTRRFQSLGEASWRHVLTFSPAEPGLSRALEIDGEKVSAGGWSDLAPSLALKNMGCDVVVYVTRQGNESDFAIGMSRLLGASPEMRRQLFASGEDSALSRSVRAADARWCTNWNDIPATEVERVSDDAYEAEMETENPYFLDGQTPYGKVSRRLNKVGCSPP